MVRSSASGTLDALLFSKRTPMSLPSVAGSLRPGASRRRPGVLFGIGFAVLLGILFADPLFSNRTFAGRDFARYFFPVERAVHEAWSQGRVPLWMPEASFGRPLASNPNVGAFYPVRVGLAALPFGFALKLFPVFHLAVAGLGAFLLARFFGISGLGAAVAAASYALGGPALGEIDYFDFMPGFALLPLVLWAAGRLARQPGPGAAAVFGLVWGIDLLAGDVFTAGLAFLGALLLTLQERGRSLAPFLRLGAAAIPGFLLAAIQFLPAALVYPSTARALSPFSWKDTLAWSISPWRLVELFVPFPFGRDQVVWGDRLWSGRTAGFFATLYPGTFAAAALLCVRPPRRARVFVYGFASASLVLAMAGFFFPESLLSRNSPLPLRYPEKLAVGFELGCALLGGFLLDALREKGARRRAIGPLAAALVLLALAAVAAREPQAVASLAQRAWTSVPTLAALGAERLPRILFGSAARWLVLAGLFFLWTPPRRALLTAACAAFVLADLGWFVRSVVSTVPSELVFGTPPMARLVREIDERGGRFVPLQDYIFPEAPSDPLNAPQEPALDMARRELSGLAGAAFGVSYAFNIDYDLSDFYRVELARRELLRDGAEWDGVSRYVASFGGHSTILRTGDTLMGFDRTVRVLGSRSLLTNAGAEPEARLAAHVREVEGVAEAYRLVHGREVDLTVTTVLETGRRGDERGSSGRVRILGRSPETLEIEAESHGPGRLLLLRAYWPFREILVDGREQAAVPANLCLTSVAVPSGRSRILLRERLPGGLAGPGLAAAGALVLVYLGIRSRKWTPAEEMPSREPSPRA